MTSIEGEYVTIPEVIIINPKDGLISINHNYSLIIGVEPKTSSGYLI